MSMSKEDAEKEVERLNDETPDWFCPLLQTLCNPACVCFAEAFVRDRIKYTQSILPVVDSITHEVVKPQCSNAMFFNQCSGC